METKICRSFALDGDGRAILTAHWKNRPVIPFENVESRLDDFYTNFQPRPDDILLPGFPKSGKHWLQHIISKLLHQDPNNDDGQMENNFIEMQTVEHFNKMPSPRVLSTHLYVDQLPPCMLNKCQKVIFVIRNPKDVAVSYFHHLRGIRRYEYADATWNGYLHLWTRSQTDNGMLNWFHHTRQWWTFLHENWSSSTTLLSDNQNRLLIIQYEHLLQNPLDYLHKLANFLNVDCSDELAENILNATKIDQLRELDKQNTPRFHLVYDNFSFYRKGEIGDWKNYFTKEQNEKFNQIYFEENQMQQLFNLQLEEFM